MTRPNILIIMSDDQGPWAMRCAGNADIITPNLDALASSGTRFTDFFCTSPVCSPARASFLTGRIPSGHGVHDWIKTGNIDAAAGVVWSGADRVIEYLAGIPGFTDVLAQNGYTCALSGKWHLGASATPQNGYSWWNAHSLGGDSYTDYHVFDNSPELRHNTEYVTDFFTRRAIDFLQAHTREQAPRPFCLSVHYTAPHAPWRQGEQPPEIWDLYEGTDFPSLPQLPPHPWGGWKPSPEARREAIRGYFTTVTAMDRAIGRLLETLDALDLRRDTLVFFLSDNGYSFGHHGVLGKGNGTYPLNMYEEAVKVPFIANCPGRLPAGEVCDAMISQYDFMPTLLDYLDLAPLPGSEDLPGRSFAPILRGEPEACRDAVVVFDEYGPTRMIRTRRWKYVHRYPDGPHELYDLRNDPGETVNCVDHPDQSNLLDDMRERLRAWFDRYVDKARDGALLPVSGLGQIDRAENHASDHPAFLAHRRSC